MRMPTSGELDAVDVGNQAVPLAPSILLLILSVTHG